MSNKVMNLGLGPQKNELNPEIYEPIDPKNLLFLEKMKDTYIEAYENAELTLEASLRSFLDLLDAFEVGSKPLDDADRSKLFFELSKVILSIPPPKRTRSSSRMKRDGLPSPAFRKFVSTYVQGLIERDKSLTRPYEDREAENSAFQHTKQILEKIGFCCSVNAIKKAYEDYL
jgi:hypothetical protein